MKVYIAGNAVAIAVKAYLAKAGVLLAEAPNSADYCIEIGEADGQAFELDCVEGPLERFVHAELAGVSPAPVLISRAAGVVRDPRHLLIGVPAGELEAAAVAIAIFRGILRELHPHATDARGRQPFWRRLLGGITIGGAAALLLAAAAEAQTPASHLPSAAIVSLEQRRGLELSIAKLEAALIEKDRQLASARYEGTRRLNDCEAAKAELELGARAELTLQRIKVLQPATEAETTFDWKALRFVLPPSAQPLSKKEQK